MNLLESTISILAPHSCIVCGTEGSLVCRWCGSDLFVPVPPRCYKCSRSTKDAAVCRQCRRKTPLTHVWVAADYEGYPKQLVGLLKFGRNRAAAKIMAEYMGNTLPYLGDTVVTFVPTASSRVRQRGYDQAQLLSKELSCLMKRKAKLFLGRLGQTRQVGATRTQRLIQLQDAFFERHTKEIKGAHVLIIDDVLTTGATLEAAAKTLKQAGAKSISAVVFAQKRL